jgi:hypothetical protein
MARQSDGISPEKLTKTATLGVPPYSMELLNQGFMTLVIRFGLNKLILKLDPTIYTSVTMTMPPERIELPTPGLQDQCSTTELKRLTNEIKQVEVVFIKFIFAVSFLWKRAFLR